MRVSKTSTPAVVQCRTGATEPRFGVVLAKRHLRLTIHTNMRVSRQRSSNLAGR